MTYPWADLNHLRFEELAKSYLEDQYPEEEWTLLPRSGDGNRDVEAVHTQNAFGRTTHRSHWVEAKYTRKTTGSLSKGQLDPTLVSAILDTSVQALMFFTNGRFPLHYILRAHQALRRISDNIHFLDKFHIESWLDKKPHIVSEYFSTIESKNASSSGSPKPVTAKLLSWQDFNDGHWEPRRNLRHHEDLILVLVIRVDKKTRVCVEMDAEGLELKPLADMPLKRVFPTGLHIMSVPVRASQVHMNGRALVTLVDDATHKIGSARLAYNVTEEPVELACSSQLKAEQALHEMIWQFDGSDRPQVLTLTGRSGDGKSYALKRVRQRAIQRSSIYCSFQEPGHNARELCKALLFSLFGSAAQMQGMPTVAGLRSNKYDEGVITALQSGTKDSAKAQDTLQNLVSSGKLYDLITSDLGGDSKLIIFDDSQKADELSLRVLSEWFEALSNAKGSLIIVVASQLGFDRLDNEVRPLLARKIVLETLTEGDIKGALQPYITSSTLRLILPEVSRMIGNILELRHLINQLSSRPEICNLRDEEAVSKFQDILMSVSIPEITARIRLASMECAAGLVAVLESGVKENYLQQHFGAASVAELLSCELFERRRLEVGSESYICVSHDLLRNAYLENHHVYSDQIAVHLQQILNDNPDRVHHILGHLCLCGKKWSNQYLKQALNTADELILNTQFGGAYVLSLTLYDLLKRQQPTELGLSAREHAQIVYNYAACVNHTDGSGFAKPYFVEVIEVASKYRGDESAAIARVNAKAELLNVRFWQHDLEGAQEEADLLFFQLASLERSLESKSLLWPRITANNRLMMMYYLHDADKLANQRFLTGLSLARANGLWHEVAHLIMDRGKCLMLENPSASLKELRKAERIYRKIPTEVRRLMICRAQIAYLKGISEAGDIFSLELLAKDLERAGFFQEYANCLLQITSLYLVGEQYDEASQTLDEVGRHKLALASSPHRRMLYCHLRGIAKALTCSHEHEAEIYLNDHFETASRLGESYKTIAQHNLNVLGQVQKVNWAFAASSNTYQIDPRIW